MAEAKIIKKYPNRSLYDTSQSKYISLTDLQQYVLEDTPFIVQEAKSKIDITRQVLLQIISEEENAGRPIFTTDVLRRFIRIYGNSAAGSFSTYIEQMSSLLDQQTRQFWEQLSARQDLSPVTTWTEIANRNMEIWQETQDKLLRASGLNRKSED
ncbi:MAG: polyhydroxyalkanoate synthesis repressor PhaR [Gammaproteobacteria bacterium RIFCSPLOWO2_12_FULL_52_10]|nr:MAG: polyhydroxyalkanoate synthesis repressor PhaR [Gammaproteobacteria bacterium RIFCSPLOWO2_12_FULL_52_10]